MKKVAIFDIDGTIFRSSLLIEFTEALIDEGIFSEKARRIYEAKYARWLDRKGSYEQYISALVESFEKQLKGILYADFCRVAESVVDCNKSRIYCYTRDLIEELKKKKYFLFLFPSSRPFLNLFHFQIQSQEILIRNFFQSVEESLFLKLKKGDKNLLPVDKLKAF